MPHSASSSSLELAEVELPPTCLPAWGIADLPEPKALEWRNWARFLGLGIVMMGIQIGGGEWLFGPEVTARYGGGLMWLATIAIVLQVFYNLECGRYALYCGEPIMTGFLRTRLCGLFYLGLAALVFITKQWPVLRNLFGLVFSLLPLIMLEGCATA